jgi:transcriptional regulator GlxA family with amidase domain
MIRRSTAEVAAELTAAGVSSRIDMALTLVARMYGPDMAEMAQLGVEYDPQPPFDAGAPSKARPEIVEFVKATIDAAFMPVCMTAKLTISSARQESLRPLRMNGGRRSFLSSSG